MCVGGIHKRMRGLLLTSLNQLHRTGGIYIEGEGGRERQRERGGKTEREGGRRRETERGCVCACVCVCVKGQCDEDRRLANEIVEQTAQERRSYIQMYRYTDVQIHRYSYMDVDSYMYVDRYIDVCRWYTEDDKSLWGGYH